LRRRQVKGDAVGMIEYYSNAIVKVKYTFYRPVRRTEFLRTISRKNSSRVLPDYWRSIDAGMQRSRARSRRRRLPAHYDRWATTAARYVWSWLRPWTHNWLYPEQSRDARFRA